MPQLIGKEIGPIGYGLMGLTWRPQPCPEEQAFKAMKASLAAGCNFWNAGEFYGTESYNSLHLLNRYFTKYPEDADKVVLSIKGLLKNMHPDGRRVLQDISWRVVANNFEHSSENVKRSVENSLEILDGKKKIDIFEPARVDKNVPFETTLKALEEYVNAGKIGGISLSEVGAATIQKAVKVTKIVAIEVELSLWSLDILNNGVANAAAEYNIPIVAYSPIGRGMLTGEITKPEDIPEGDFRKTMPRFSPENFNHNLELVSELYKIAKQKGCTPAQLAISWVLHLSNKDGNPEIIPIPGATKEERVLENGKVISLSNDDISEIDSILKKFEVKGDRYGGPQKAHIEG